MRGGHLAAPALTKDGADDTKDTLDVHRTFGADDVLVYCLTAGFSPLAEFSRNPTDI